MKIATKMNVVDACCVTAHAARTNGRKVVGRKLPEMNWVLVKGGPFGEKGRTHCFCSTKTGTTVEHNCPESFAFSIVFSSIFHPGHELRPRFPLSFMINPPREVQEQVVAWEWNEVEFFGHGT